MTVLLEYIYLMYNSRFISYQASVATITYNSLIHSDLIIYYIFIQRLFE